jgi:hypothetical protein
LKIFSGKLNSYLRKISSGNERNKALVIFFRFGIQALKKVGQPMLKRIKKYVAGAIAFILKCPNFTFIGLALFLTKKARVTAN